MPDPNSMFGFAGGQIQVQQAQDAHAINLQNLTKGELDIKQTELMLDRQQALIDHLHKMSDPRQTQPGPMGPSPMATQALSLANEAMDLGNAFMEQGFFKEGGEALDRGVRLLENSQKIEQHDLDKQAAMWKTISQLAPGVKNQAQWDNAKMMFMLQHPEMAQNPEVQKILKQQYSPDLIDLLERSSVTALQQADIRKAEAETQAAEARTRATNVKTASQPIIDELNKQRIDRLKREGEQGTKKQQEMADLRESTIDDITDLIDQINAHPEVVGATGYLSRGKEILQTIRGHGDTPAHVFQNKVDSTLLKLPKALTGSSKSAKDERSRVDEIANVLRLGNTPDIAIQKLQQLKATLRGEQLRSKVKPSGDQPANMSLDTYLNIMEGKTGDE